MKKIILSLAIASFAIQASAQEAEINAVKDAYKSNNFSQALQQATLAESKLASNATIAPETIAEFYYNAGKAAKASGDLVRAGEYFAKLKDIESNPYYKTKNKDTKSWEYYFTKAAAEKATASGNYTSIKDGQISKSLLNTELETLNQEANASLKSGNEAFNAQDYAKAGDEFTKAFYLYKAIGQEKPLFKYYAALGYVQSENFSTAAKMFQSLIDEGFTGVETSYIATNTDGQDVSFSSQEDMDTQVKLGLVSNPRTEQSDSLEEDLFSNATYTYYKLEDYDKAVKVGQAGLAKYPSNENMNKLVSASFHNSGNTAQFIANLQEKADNGTANAVDYFNLAKSLEDQDADANHELAKQYYQKAIALDPQFSDAYLNLAFLIIAPEKEYVSQMNANLGASANEKKIYNQNKQKRKKLYQEALPYLEKAYAQNENNPSLIKILKNTYEVVGNDDKYTEFKAKYDALATEE